MGVSCASESKRGGNGELLSSVPVVRMSGPLPPPDVRRAAARVFKDPAAFRELTPASLRGNVQVAMAAVSSPAKTVCNFLQSASWCQGQDFILPSLVCGFLAEDAVHQRSWALRFASEELRGDREFMLAAVKQSGYALQHASDELRGDAEVVLAAVRRHGYALCALPRSRCRAIARWCWRP